MGNWRRAGERGASTIGVLVGLLLFAVAAYLFYAVFGAPITNTWQYEFIGGGLLLILAGILILWRF